MPCSRAERSIWRAHCSMRWFICSIARLNSSIWAGSKPPPPGPPPRPGIAGIAGKTGMRTSRRLPSGPTKNITFPPLPSRISTSIASAASPKFIPSGSAKPSTSMVALSSCSASNSTAVTSILRVSVPRRTSSAIFAPGSASRSTL